MKKTLLYMLPFLLLASCGETGEDASSASSSNEPVEEEQPNTVLNGGFEEASLDGWEVLWGDAYDDASVSSSSFFRFDYDEDHQEISRGKEGNWYLDGKGYHGRRRGSRTGAIRSSSFYLDETGEISFKLAGGSPVVGRGSNQKKDDERICFLGVYESETGRMIAKQRNDYFVEQNDSYVSADKYEAGVFGTDNFASYSLSLLPYVGKELYLQIVDPDTSSYYGYLSVDDIRIGGESAQPIGPSYTKTPVYEEDVEAPSPYQIKNGGFESGSLAGWDVLEGEAFSHDGVNAEKTWWNENITYSRDGEFHYGHYRPSATGRMRSSSFILGGSGFVTFKLGGGMRQDLSYLSFIVESEEGEVEVARYANHAYWNFQFPFVENGMRLLNMNQYVADLSLYLGQKMHIEVVDADSSPDELGCITMDSIETFHEKRPEFFENNFFYAHNSLPLEVYPFGEHQPLNGGFETGDLTGWQASSGSIGEVSNDPLWWGEHATNVKGKFLFTGEKQEGNQGELLSSPFVLGGSGHITYSLGGAKDPRLVYMSLINDETGEELGRYGNPYFNDLGEGAINQGSNLLNMLPYDLDASEHLGKTLRIKLVDHSSADWGLLSFDSLCTYHPTLDSIPQGSFQAKNLLSSVRKEEKADEIRNGNFESGSLEGWQKEGDVGDISSSSIFWAECFNMEQEGSYYFSGWKGNEEAEGSLVSSPFVVNEVAKLTFRLGGMKHSERTYLSLIEEESGKEVARYRNSAFDDALRYRYCFPGMGKTNRLSEDGKFMANFACYVADLSAFKGKTLRVKLVDNASSDWGLFFADDFRAGYASEEEIDEKYIPAVSLLG